MPESSCSKTREVHSSFRSKTAEFSSSLSVSSRLKSSRQCLGPDATAAPTQAGRPCTCGAEQLCRCGTAEASKRTQTTREHMQAPPHLLHCSCFRKTGTRTCHMWNWRLPMTMQNGTVGSQGVQRRAHRRSRCTLTPTQRLQTQAK